MIRALQSLSRLGLAAEETIDVSARAPRFYEQSSGVKRVAPRNGTCCDLFIFSIGQHAVAATNTVRVPQALASQDTCSKESAS
jgi:hypothetical protein